MEYADGGTLRNYLKKHFDNLTWNDKLNLALQLTRAVSCLHDEGIVHRDLVINLYCYYEYYVYYSLVI
jgi:serine/threonine protein kinase